MFIAGCVCENCGKLLKTKFTTMGKLITFARDSGWSVSNHRQGRPGSECIHTVMTAANRV